MAVDPAVVTGLGVVLNRIANFAGDAMKDSPGFLPIFSSKNITDGRVYVRKLSSGDMVARVDCFKLDGAHATLNARIEELLNRASPFLRLETPEKHSWPELFKQYRRMYVAPLSVVGVIYNDTDSRRHIMSENDRNTLERLNDTSWTQLTLNQQTYVVPLLLEEVLYELAPTSRKAWVWLNAARSFVLNYVLLNRVPVTTWIRNQYDVNCTYLAPLDCNNPHLWQ